MARRVVGQVCNLSGATLDPTGFKPVLRRIAEVLQISHSSKLELITQFFSHGWQSRPTDVFSRQFIRGPALLSVGEKKTVGLMCPADGRPNPRMFFQVSSSVDRLCYPWEGQCPVGLRRILARTVTSPPRITPALQKFLRRTDCQSVLLLLQLRGSVAPR